MTTKDKKETRASHALNTGILPYLTVLLGAAFLLGCSGGEQKAANTGPEPAKQTSAANVTDSNVTKMPGDKDNGRKIYEKYCHFCHGMKGYGNGPVGTAITPHPADFVNDTKRMSKTDEELFKSITEGVHRAVGGDEMYMPRWADILTPRERWDVLAYVRYLSAEGQKEQQKAQKK